MKWISYAFHCCTLPIVVSYVPLYTAITSYRYLVHRDRDTTYSGEEYRGG